MPLSDAELSADRVTVPYTKDFVKDAPNLDADGHLTPEEEQQLYAYYGRTMTPRTGTRRPATPYDRDATTGRRMTTGPGWRRVGSRSRHLRADQR